MKIMKKKEPIEGRDQLIKHKKWLLDESNILLDQLRGSCGVITLLNGKEIEVDRTVINYLQNLVTHDDRNNFVPAFNL